MIGCDAEAGIERELTPDETPDGRPGVSLLLFSFGREKLEQAVFNRVAQCILTCPTTACYNGLPIDPAKSLRVGGQLRFFGDGWQQSKLLDGRRFWRIPVMDGEFLCEDRFGTTKGVAGGNFLILAESQEAGLRAAESAVAAIAPIAGVITPFPGGVVRSGSKVGSRYKKLRASTNDSVLSDAARPGQRTSRRLQCGLRDCHRRTRFAGRRGSDTSRRCVRHAARACWRSAPVTTAANWGRSCYTCDNLWGDLCEFSPF